MKSAIAVGERLLTRQELAEALTDAGFRTSSTTLATFACRGCGPAYQSYGRTPLYGLSNALVWQRTASVPPPRHVRRTPGGSPLEHSPNSLKEKTMSVGYNPPFALSSTVTISATTTSAGVALPPGSDTLVISDPRLLWRGWPSAPGQRPPRPPGSGRRVFRAEAHDLVPSTITQVAAILSTGTSSIWHQTSSERSDMSDDLIHARDMTPAQRAATIAEISRAADIETLRQYEAIQLRNLIARMSKTATEGE